MTPRCDRVTLEGRVRIDVRDAVTGRLVRRERGRNLVVLVGRNQIRNALAGQTITAPNRIALGSDDTAVSAADTALVTEVWRDVLTSVSTGSGTVTYKYFLTTTTANGNTLREAGLVNAAAGGDLTARIVYNDIFKTAGVTVLFVWTIAIGAA